MLAQFNRSTFRMDAIVGVATAVLLLSTSVWIPLVWDEPNAILRAERLEGWLWQCLDPLAASWPPFGTQTIQEYCQYTTQIEGHPAFYGITIAVGRAITQHILPGWMSWRFGPILLFSLAVSAAFHRLSVMYGRGAAFFSIFAILTMPRVFAHAHFASIDGPLTSCWLLTWACFDWARRSGTKGSVIWGVLLGLTWSCKFTGWFSTVGFLAWAIAFRDLAGLKVCLIGVCVALLTFVDLNPALWSDVAAGLYRFFEMNLGRLSHGHNIPTYFAGERYDLKHPLPWYNTLAWTALTVPPATLVLGSMGLLLVLWRSRSNPLGALIAFNWVLLMIVRAVPMAPPHDAERLFLPSFPFFGLLAGVGWHATTLAWTRRKASSAACLTQIAFSLVIGFAAIETVWYSPQWLSYYSPLVGGLRGATALGFEPTYYWDGLDDELLGWLRDHTDAGDRVYYSVTPDFDKLMLRDGGWPFILTGSDPAGCKWYLVQNRTSLLTDTDRALLASAKPDFVKTIRDPARGISVWRLDIPLVLVYSKAQVLAVVEKHHSTP